MSNKLKLGIFGFGCVGQGLYEVLSKSNGFRADILKICVKDKNKKRPIDASLFTFDKFELLNDPEINVIVELIDDADEAYNIVKHALQWGKHVVTANKKMLAEHLQEFIELQHTHNVSLLYEAATCGSIPIIRTLEEYFDNEDLEKVSGIFNGTTNYIVTKTISENITYEEALRQAQEKGFAETDPTNDVEGFDPKFKAIIIALHAFGLIIKPEQVLNLGITGLHANDIKYASGKGYKIKLTPVIKRIEDKISVFVVPAFVTSSDHLYNVDNEFNGVIVEGKFSGEQFLQGKGAGSYPTGAAVLSDISALSHGYKYEFKKQVQGRVPAFTNDVLLHVYFRYSSSEDLKRFDFDEINEKYAGSEYNYIIGKLSLQQIISQRKYILDNKLFISLVNDSISLDINKQIRKTEKELELTN